MDSAWAKGCVRQGSLTDQASSVSSLYLPHGIIAKTPMHLVSAGSLLCALSVITPEPPAVCHHGAGSTYDKAKATHSGGSTVLCYHRHYLFFL